MEYEAIRSQLTAKRGELMRATRRQRELKDMTDESEVALVSLLNKVEVDVQGRKEAEKRDGLQAIVTPLQREIERCNIKSRELLDSYNKQKSSVSAEEIFQELKKQDEVSSEAPELIQEIKSLVKEDLGERFVLEYEKQLGTFSQISEDKLVDYFNEFPSIKDDVERLANKKAFPLEEKLGTWLSSVSRGKADQSPKGLIIFAATVLLGLVLASFILLPLYLGFLVSTIIRNIKKGRVYSQSLIKLKCVEDNLYTINSMLMTQAEEDYAEELKRIEGTFSASSAQLESVRTQLVSQLEFSKERFLNNFSFDEETYRESLFGIIEAARNRVSQSKSQYDEATKLLTSLEGEINRLNQELNDSLGSLKVKFFDLDSLSKEVIYSPEFLLDIKENKPVFFQHPMKSTLIFYNEYEEAINFMKLIMLQIRCRLSVHNFKITLIDTNHVGRDFSQFFTKETKNFELVYEQDAVKDALSPIDSTWKQRNDMIMKRYESIQEYNKEMVRIESMPEMYQFLWVLDPYPQLLQDPILIRMFKVGSPVGIFPFLITNPALLDKNSVDILTDDCTSFSLENGELKRRAHEFVIQNILGFEK